MNDNPLSDRRTRLLILGLVLGILAAIAIAQNFETAEVKLLFWKAEAPLAVMLATFMAIGAGVDTLIRRSLRRRREQRTERPRSD